MTKYELAAYAYMILLAAGTFYTAVKGSRAMKRTIYTVAANYALAFGYTWITRDPDPWPWFMALDFIAALIILIRPAGIAQGLVGVIYVFMMATHTGYAINGSKADPFVYWWLLTVFAFVQLLLIGGWALHERGYRLPDLRWWRRGPYPAHQKGAKG